MILEKKGIQIAIEKKLPLRCNYDCPHHYTEKKHRIWKQFCKMFPGYEGFMGNARDSNCIKIFGFGIPEKDICIFCKYCENGPSGTHICKIGGFEEFTIDFSCEKFKARF